MLFHGKVKTFIHREIVLNRAKILLMALDFAKNIKNILKKHQFLPSKGLGQNFLTDENAIKRVIIAADLESGNVVLEVGPGLGALTKELAKKAARVIAVEKDPKMVEILRETLKDYKNVEIVLGDILKIENLKLIENWKLKIENYKVAANLPFYLTAPLIRKFLEEKTPPEDMTLVVQKEVGQRIVARPPEMSILAVSVQFYAQAKIVSYISKESFWPKPKVDAAILKIIPFALSKNPATAGFFDKDLFFKIVKAGFSQPRKQLINNLSQKLEIDKEKIKSWLSKNGIYHTQRAETLEVKDWINLTKTFKIN